MTVTAVNMEVQFGFIVIQDIHDLFYPFVSSNRSSCSDDGLVYIQQGHFLRFSLSPLMQLMLQVSL